MTYYKGALIEQVFWSSNWRSTCIADDVPPARSRRRVRQGFMNSASEGRDARAVGSSHQLYSMRLRWLTPTLVPSSVFHLGNQSRGTIRRLDIGRWTEHPGPIKLGSQNIGSTDWAP